jgi:hypothetical protein
MKKLFVLLACCGLFLGCEASKTAKTPAKTKTEVTKTEPVKTDLAPDAPKKTE